MNATVQRLNRESATRWEWKWTALRQADTQHIATEAFPRPYNHPVPLHALQKIAQILKRLPEAYFRVTEIVNRPKADPFLLVQILGSDPFVIDQWDEPSFTGRATPVV